MPQTWMFQNAEGRDNAKEFMSYRHPSNLTEWLDEWTIKLEDPIHKQVELLLRRAGAKKID